MLEAFKGPKFPPSIRGQRRELRTHDSLEDDIPGKVHADEQEAYRHGDDYVDDKFPFIHIDLPAQIPRAGVTALCIGYSDKEPTVFSPQTPIGCQGDTGSKKFRLSDYCLRYSIKVDSCPSKTRPKSSDTLST